MVIIGLTLSKSELVGEQTRAILRERIKNKNRKLKIKEYKILQASTHWVEISNKEINGGHIKRLKRVTKQNGKECGKDW